jgi:hypothetical protein
VTLELRRRTRGSVVSSPVEDIDHLRTKTKAADQWHLRALHKTVLNVNRHCCGLAGHVSVESAICCSTASRALSSGSTAAVSAGRLAGADGWSTPV